MITLVLGVVALGLLIWRVSRAVYLLLGLKPKRATPVVPYSEAEYSFREHEPEDWEDAADDHVDADAMLGLWYGGKTRPRFGRRVEKFPRS